MHKGLTGSLSLSSTVMASRSSNMQLGEIVKYAGTGEGR